MWMEGPLSEWEYSGHQNVKSVDDYCKKLLDTVVGDVPSIHLLLNDTRSAHKGMFEGVTPENHGCLAGNYRGSSDCPQLSNWNVSIGSYCGTESCFVSSSMEMFHAKINNGLHLIERHLHEAEPRKKILAYTRLVSACFVDFLVIHPYANGNGHISRLLVWCLLSIKFMNCNFWNVPKRNAEPTCKEIAQCREGNWDPLLLSFFALIENENKDIQLH